MDHIEPRKITLKRLMMILAAFLILGLFFFMLNEDPWSKTSIRAEPGTVYHTENPWVLKREDTVLDPALQLPAFLALDSGVLHSVSTTLQYDGSQDEMPYGFLHVDHMFCRVIYNGEVLFSYMPEDVHKPDASQSPGYIYKAFALPHDCLGKTLEVQFISSLSTPIEYGLPRLNFGDYSSMVHAAFARDLPHNVVTLFCMMLGIAAILFSAATLTGSDFREGISIGAFALLFSLYLLTECKINYYYIATPYYLYLLNYVVFSLIPISLMGFMQERLPGISKKSAPG